MSRRTDPDLRQLDDAAFARQLLAAAVADAPPPSASERAFRELASDAQALAALATLAAPPPGTLAAPLPGTARPLSGRRRSPLEWLLVGAVAGGSAVALWLAPLTAPPPVPPLPPRPALEQPAVPALAPEAAPERRAEQGAPAVSPGRVLPRDLPPRAVRGQPMSRTRESTPVEGARASRLAQEVAAIDAARAALAVGAAASALRQIERYHGEFPEGELAADAEAVAIEALAAQGDHAALAAAAERFLARYPRDPHAPRVRELAFIKPPLPEP